MPRRPGRGKGGGGGQHRSGDAGHAIRRSAQDPAATGPAAGDRPELPAFAVLTTVLQSLVAVTARRRAEGRPEPGRPWAGLASWTLVETAEYDRLHAAAVAAAEARWSALDEASLGHGYDVVQALHLAAQSHA